MNDSRGTSLTNIWYRDHYAAHCLAPLEWGFRTLVDVRRRAYRNGMLAVKKLPVPVIVVGNISVGGTGKTPLIIALARFLQRNGYRPGIVSRGYRGRIGKQPVKVQLCDSPALVGDEALLLAKHGDCPVAVCTKRYDAGRLLVEQENCDVILSDDGLQHYKLARDIEIAVVDGERRYGNGRCLPAGPLREPVDRLNEVDFIVVNGEPCASGQYSMQLSGDLAINLATGAAKPLAHFVGSESHAVAGIGNPKRFFKMLADAGLTCRNHEFPDHHPYRAGDLDFDDKPVLMTEKDAVKCFGFARENYWYVPVSAQLDPALTERLLTLLREKNDGYKTA
ncbi:MAG: tetraacyldisaccharide 4'-kinase [Methylomicrobium sp.]